jgi:hypothetical protein
MQQATGDHDVRKEFEKSKTDDKQLSQATLTLKRL